MNFRQLVCLTILFSSCTDAVSQPSLDVFDPVQLSGIWVEGIDTGQACGAHNLHHRFVLSEDGQTLVFKLDRRWKIANDKEVNQYSANIIKATAHSLTIEYLDLAGLPEGYPTQWDIAFVAEGVYRWKASHWPEDKVNSVVGVRCAK